jgi:hypothetical protein
MRYYFVFIASKFQRHYIIEDFALKQYTADDKYIIVEPFYVINSQNIPVKTFFITSRLKEIVCENVRGHMYVGHFELETISQTQQNDNLSGVTSDITCSAPSRNCLNWAGNVCSIREITLGS